MSEFIISLLMLVVFAGCWTALFVTGGLDWIVDSRVASARRMLANSKFAFDGEMHVVHAIDSGATANKAAAKNTSQPQSGWIPQALSHA